MIKNFILIFTEGTCSSIKFHSRLIRFADEILNLFNLLINIKMRGNIFSLSKNLNFSVLLSTSDIFLNECLLKQLFSELLIILINFKSGLSNIFQDF